MKKTAWLLVILLLLTGTQALADNLEFFNVDSGTTAYFGTPYDETQQTFTFSTEVDEYGDGSFNIAINDMEYKVENCTSLEPVVYAVSLNALSRGTLFMVNEYGQSDDPVTYCFLYENDNFSYVGSIHSYIASLQIDERGVFTTDVRAKYLGTWYHPADYILADGFEPAEDGGYLQYTSLCEVPRDVYPMGMIVDLNVDLPLFTSRYVEEYGATLNAGEKVILAASDDCHWLYITSLDGTTAGWVYMLHEADSYVSMFPIGEQLLSETEVFSNILYAD